MNRLRRMVYSHDFRALGLLVLLWLLFFWRLFTPIAADQASFKQGDFSGQFVAFGGYQYQRMTQGEIPLWNPYNNGGLPFIADTQAAVFYPPRWLTIAAAHASGGWSYNALQMEAVAHVLAYTLLTYAFVRRRTLGAVGSIYGSFIAAVVAGYGGFVAGYPPLQLALLEAAIWLPLTALALLEATRRPTLNWRWLLVAGAGLGLSWLAGHPQTSVFMTYLMVAWYGWRCYGQRYHWRPAFLGLLLFGVVTFGMTSVTLLPGAEYLLLTARTDLGFDAKGNGFPFQDFLQFVLPATVSVFSPLYVGLPALMLAYLALRQKLAGAWFWGAVFIIGLAHSVGANSVFFHLVYNIVPGLRFFRGQERAAFLVANSLAILAGMGAAYLVNWETTYAYASLRRFMRVLVLVIVGGTLLISGAWLGFREEYGALINAAWLSSIVIVLAYLLIEWHLRQPRQVWALGLLALLLIFELFSVNMDAPSNYESRTAASQLSITPPERLGLLLSDASAPFRVDGFRGLEANYGSLYGVMDIRGISPLFLTSAQRIIYKDYTHNPLAWELFAVKYVFSERESFSTPTRVIAQTSDSSGAIYLHGLTNPRPFALLLYKADTVDSDEFAWALLNDPAFVPRESVIIKGAAGIDLPATPPIESGSASITTYQPEHIVIEIDAPENALLSLAQIDYPGWRATLDGDDVPILRAYGALMALPVPAGNHTLELHYTPRSYQIGLIITLATWGGLGMMAVATLFLRRRPSTHH